MQVDVPCNVSEKMLNPTKSRKLAKGFRAFKVGMSSENELIDEKGFSITR